MTSSTHQAKVAFRISWNDYNLAKDRAFQYGFGKPSVWAKQSFLDALMHQSPQALEMRLHNIQTMARMSFRLLLKAMEAAPKAQSADSPQKLETAEASRAKVESGISHGPEISFRILPDDQMRAQEQAVRQQFSSVHAYAQFLFYEGLAADPKERLHYSLTALEQTILDLFAQGIEHTSMSEQQAAWCFKQVERYAAATDCYERAFQQTETLSPESTPAPQR